MRGVSRMPEEVLHARCYPRWFACLVMDLRLACRSEDGPVLGATSFNNLGSARCSNTQSWMALALLSSAKLLRPRQSSPKADLDVDLGNCRMLGCEGCSGKKFVQCLAIDKSLDSQFERALGQ